MCWQIAPLLLTAAGTAAQYKSQHDLARDKEREAAEGILRQSQLNREADTKVAQATQKIASSNADEATAERRAAYMDALRKSLGTRAGAVPVNGAVSKAFQADSDAARADTEAEAAQEAGLQAAIDAPRQQRLNEGVQMNNLGVDLGLLQGQSGSADYLMKLRLALKKANPWLEAGGAIAKGAGSALAGNAGGGSVYGDAVPQGFTYGVNA